jgi:hypothetical protein
MVRSVNEKSVPDLPNTICIGKEIHKPGFL